MGWQDVCRALYAGYMPSAATLLLATLSRKRRHHGGERMQAFCKKNLRPRWHVHTFAGAHVGLCAVDMVQVAQGQLAQGAAKSRCSHCVHTTGEYLGRFVPGSCTVICEKHNHQSLPICHMSQPGMSESPASRPAAGGDGIGDSVFVVDPDAPVYDMPMSAISRPIPSVLDEAKVQDFTCKLQVVRMCIGLAVCIPCHPCCLGGYSSSSTVLFATAALLAGGHEADAHRSCLGRARGQELLLCVRQLPQVKN